MAKQASTAPETWHALQRRRTFAALLEAARLEFLEQGYTATTIEDITSRAGVKRATFYLHFPGKSAIVVELMRRSESELSQLWEPLRLLSRRPSRAAVRAWIESLLRGWEPARETTAMLHLASASEPELLAYQAESEERQLDLLVDCLSHLPWLDANHVRLEAMLLLAQLEQFFYYHSLAPRDLDASWVVEILTDSWWRALNRAKGRAPAPARAATS